MLVRNTITAGASTRTSMKGTDASPSDAKAATALVADKITSKEKALEADVVVLKVLPTST